MGFHADDEPELGPNAPSNVLIASVSLGERRRFIIKRRDRSQTLKVDLGGGDLYVMGGAAQQHWVHGVPKTTRAVGPRMSLTFRIVRS
jgi:alkylated DNA repair dioxygenase AlkB